MPLPPGIGNDQQAAEATAFMREQPWYRALLQSWGVNPDNPGDFHLDDDQQAQLLRTARDHGLGISDRYEIDRNGAIREGGHKLRNTLIGAGIAGSLLIPGVAPAIGGLFAGGGGAAGGMGAAGAGIGSAGAGVGAVGAGAGGVAASLGTAGAIGGAGLAVMKNAAGGADDGFGLPDWLKAAQDVGGALSAGSAGRAQGRIAEALANQQQNRTAVDLYNTELQAPRTIARNAVKGDVLANAQDATVSGISPNIPVPTISGGLRPSMFSASTRQLGRDISGAAARTPIPTPTAPVLPELPQAGGLDEFLNTGSTIANVAGSVPWDKIPWGKIGSLFS